MDPDEENRRALHSVALCVIQEGQDFIRSVSVIQGNMSLFVSRLVCARLQRISKY